MFDLKVTSHKSEFEFRNVEGVNLPTVYGRRGILPNHMPIMIPVCIGVMHIRNNGRTRKFAVAEGVFTFENNQAILLTSDFEDVETIDIEKARQAQQKALEMLQAAGSDSDIQRAEIALNKAINRIKAYDER